MRKRKNKYGLEKLNKDGANLTISGVAASVLRSASRSYARRHGFGIRSRTNDDGTVTIMRVDGELMEMPPSIADGAPLKPIDEKMTAALIIATLYGVDPGMVREAIEAIRKVIEE